MVCVHERTPAKKPRIEILPIKYQSTGGWKFPNEANQDFAIFRFEAFQGEKADIDSKTQNTESQVTVNNILYSWWL